MKTVLKKLIKEEVYNFRLSIINENILQDIMSLILTPRLKKAIKSIKADPEYKELEQQIKKSKEELELITKRLERNLERRSELVKDMNKAGIDVTLNMDSDQIYNAFKSWQSKEAKKIGKPEWAKYFK
jgi:hypothetical protein